MELSSARRPVLRPRLAAATRLRCMAHAGVPAGRRTINLSAHVTEFNSGTYASDR